MTQKGKGPRENSSSGTAPDQNAYSDASVVTDDTESVVATQAPVVPVRDDQVELIDGKGSPDPDSGRSVYSESATNTQVGGPPG